MCENNENVTMQGLHIQQILVILGIHKQMVYNFGVSNGIKGHSLWKLQLLYVFKYMWQDNV